MKKRVISWMLVVVVIVSMVLGTNVFGKPGAVQAEELNQTQSTVGLNYHTDDTEKISLVEVPEDYSYSLTVNRMFNSASTSSSNYNDQADKFDTTYGYQDLALRNNGAGRQKLYNEIMASVKKFENSNADASNTYYSFVDINYASMGLTKDEAVETYYIFRNDNPYYYWLSSSIVYNSTRIYISTYEDYYQSSVRSSYDAKIANKINEFKTALGDYQLLTDYDIALKIHNKIINEIMYALDSTNKPEESAWAHNIIGAMDNTHYAAVCEGYAKTFEMLLNYFDVGNVYVTGTGNGGGHAWNVVQMDDSNWYCTDVTWDDQPSWPNGIMYKYFNCNVSEFNKLHTASTPSDTGVNFLYALPVLSDSTAYMYANRNQYTYTATKTKAVTCTENGLIQFTCIQKADSFTRVISALGHNYTGVITKAATASEDGDEVFTCSNCGDSYHKILPATGSAAIGDISWKFDETSGTLIISGTGKLRDCSDGLGTEITPSMVPWYSYKSQVKQVMIEEGIIATGEATFWGYENLVSVSLPVSLTKLSDDTFYNCVSLKTIVIPKNTTYLGAEAFRGCIALTSAVINTANESGSIIGNGLFTGCTSLKEINVSVQSTTMKSVDGVLFSKHNILLQYPVGRESTYYQVPSDTIGIMGSSFWDCKFLESIDIPDSITVIDDHTFDGCTKLKNVMLPTTLKKIGAYAFYDCSSLSNLTLPDSLEIINVYAFGQCSLLTDIKLPAGLKTIGAEAFFRCYSLTTIVIPDNVTEIGDGVFQECTSLKNVFIFPNVTVIKDRAFYDSTGVVICGLPGSYAQTFANKNHFTFRAYAPLTGISLNKVSDKILKGNTDTLTVIYNPVETTDDTSVTWKSSNDTVATVDAAGKVTAVATGTATITATTLDGTKTADCVVTVVAFQLGDVTMDNIIDIYDILEIQRYILGITTLTENTLAAADVTGSGNVDIYDILAIQRHILGIELIAN